MLAKIASPRDEDILDELQRFNPVLPDSEKNIWGFWNQGLRNCPAWIRRNIVSWVRRCEKDGWTVRILDMVHGSETHASRYIPPDYLPECFLHNTFEGPFVGPNSSDIPRLPLLYLYGGVWLDVTYTLFRSLDTLVWNVLSDPTRPEELATMRAMLGPRYAIGNNGFIASRKGCLATKYWHDFANTLPAAKSTHRR